MGKTKVLGPNDTSDYVRDIAYIVEMLFAVKGATASAILMEWNVHESHQGSAAMWDSHFRVGGGMAPS